MTRRGPCEGVVIMPGRSASPSAWRLAALVVLGPAAGAFVVATFVHMVARELLSQRTGDVAAVIGGAIGVLAGGMAAARAAAPTIAGADQRTSAGRVVALLASSAAVLLVVGAPAAAIATLPVRIALAAAAVFIGMRVAR